MCFQQLAVYFEDFVMVVSINVLTLMLLYKKHGLNLLSLPQTVSNLLTLTVLIVLLAIKEANYVWSLNRTDLMSQETIDNKKYIYFEMQSDIILNMQISCWTS